jgi:hypothetical protein
MNAQDRLEMHVDRCSVCIAAAERGSDASDECDEINELVSLADLEQDDPPPGLGRNA